MFSKTNSKCEAKLEVVVEETVKLRAYLIPAKENQEYLSILSQL